MATVTRSVDRLLLEEQPGFLRHLGISDDGVGILHRLNQIPFQTDRPERQGIDEDRELGVRTVPQEFHAVEGEWDVPNNQVTHDHHGKI
jgi:hypothetical protein